MSNDNFSGHSDRLRKMLDDTTPAKPPARKRAPAKAKAGNVSISGTGNVVGDGNVIHINHLPAPVVNRVVVVPGEGVITAKQQADLKALVDDIVALESDLRKSPKRHAAVWSALNKKMGVTSYHQIPGESFNSALKYLNQWRGRLQSGKSAPKKLGDELTERRKKAIHARCRNVPNGLPRRKAYMQEHFGAASLTDLDPMQIEQVYRYVMGWKQT
ncbi:ORF6C domain-containing protein [Castellaniella sp.]|uniref:ORF6C domain-containing protein n=1 Tax=Castellaniella sp. TaxID=1955812 RepID=UPI002AFF483E|nr:ORF6C domain-containing protein [Castellaniella sp.]